jgi:hypothetical protein
VERTATFAAWCGSTSACIPTSPRWIWPSRTSHLRYPIVQLGEDEVLVEIRDRHLSPSVQRIVAENNLDVSRIAGSGNDGRITKGDALAALSGPAPSPSRSGQSPPLRLRPRANSRRARTVRMTRLRHAIARRLKESQNTAAMLMTFNEVDISAVMAHRNAYKDAFEKRFPGSTSMGSFPTFVRAKNLASPSEVEIVFPPKPDSGVYALRGKTAAAVHTEEHHANSTSAPFARPACNTVRDHDLEARIALSGVIDPLVSNETDAEVST